MKDLQTEISRFFEWAKITHEEFALGKAPDFAIQAEWTNEYPYYSDFCRSIPSAIDKLDAEWHDDLANMILTAIAIDDEDSFVIDQLSENFSDLVRFTKFGYNHENPRTRVGIIDLLYNNDLPNRDEILSILKNDPDIMVSIYANHDR